MAIFAIVNNKKVTNTVVADELIILNLLLPNETIIEETESTGIAWIGSEVIGGKFKPPQRFESWLFSNDKFVWEAPVPYPSDGLNYYWSEADLDWLIIPEPEPTPVE